MRHVQKNHKIPLEYQLYIKSKKGKINIKNDSVYHIALQIINSIILEKNQNLESIIIDIDDKKYEYLYSSESDSLYNRIRWYSDNCYENQIFTLKDKQSQESFFKQLNLVISKQYPPNKEKEILDITPQILNQFINDIDKTTFSLTKSFTKEYKFNLVPNQYSNSKDYKNTISITFDEKECTYRLTLINFYQTDEWSDETSIVYSFRILYGEIIDFRRQEAG